jgi:4-diphosphocytidyl-2-C-methyl-D-erythritol kinase
MIVFPNCKINLGLRILRKRTDGYHDLETVFYPLHLKDVLELVQVSEDRQAGTRTAVNFSTSGIDAGNPEENICIKAYELLKKDFPSLPPANMHLHKTIPTGAGLGGGSADAAFTLKLLNEKFNLGLTEKQLINYSLQLGSDCPFFIINKPCFATGRGELLEQINIDLKAYKIILVNTGINSSTANAFKHIIPALPRKSVKEIIQQSIETWKDELINDFEKPLFQQHPELKNIKDQLYNSGAVYAAMSGSGSSVYGIFPKETSLSVSFNAAYFVKELAS